MRLPIILFGLLTAATLAHAQSRERGSASFVLDSESDLEGAAGDSIAIRESEFSTGVPVSRGPRHSFSVGLRWTRYAFEVESADFDDTVVNSVRAPLRFNYRGFTNWVVLASLTPGLSTDFDGVNGDDLVLGAMLLGNYRWSETLTLSAGAGYSQAFGTSRGFPALGLTWQAADILRVELVFPRPRIVVTPTPDLDLFALVEPAGDKWNIRDEGRSRDLALEEYRCGLGFEWRFHPNLAWVTMAGGTVNRQLDLRDGDERIFRKDIDDGWFVRTGLRFL